MNLRNLVSRTRPACFAALGHTLLVAAACGPLSRAWAQAPLATETEPPSHRITWSISDETWALPAGERMGMTGGRILLDASDHWKVGAAAYGAVRGQRGGFITLGVETQGEWAFTDRQSLVGGLFVGGGGGRDGRALAGGGLMLRANAGVEHRFGQAHRIGAGISHVRFPSGTIRSTQPYMSYAYAFPSLVWSGWPARPASGGLKLDGGGRPLEREFAVVLRHYQIPNNVRRDDGSPQHPTMDLLGAEWTSYLDDRWFLRLAGDGALGGENAGYMQILLGGGYRLPMGRGQALRLHALAGPAGGGGADTGGGLLTDVGLGWQVHLTPRKSLELSLSHMRAPSRSFEARNLAIKLVHHLDASLPGGASQVGWASQGGLDAQRLRVRLVQQRYEGASPGWRCCYPDTPVDNLGLALDYMLSPADAPRQWFLTGQGIAAYDGQAGAYMTGLVGAGARQWLTPRTFVEAEALVGAAGGGGLRTGGGLVSQANLSAGYALSPRLDIMLTAGRMKALRDSFSARVLGLSAVYRMTVASKP